MSITDTGRGGQPAGLHRQVLLVPSGVDLGAYLFQRYPSDKVDRFMKYRCVLGSSPGAGTMRS